MTVTRLLISALLLTTGAATAQAPAVPPVARPSVADAQVEDFRLLETGSVADAIEQLYGIRTYLSHEFRPLQEERFVGRAVTVQFSREEHKEGSQAISGMVDLLDTALAGSVYVMAMPDGKDFGAIGGMMATTMKVRGFAGAVVDGGVRDVGQIRKLGFPVFSRSVAPSTTVNHFRFVAANVPVKIGNVTIEAGDIVMADADGVVVIPKAKAAEILTRARELDYVEHATLPYIEKYRSLKKAVATYGRL
jgi:regulator of RNase E activity RraA